MTTSKAKEMYWSIIQHWCGAPAEYEDPIVSKRFDEWLRTKSAAALLSGEDWISVETKLPENINKYLVAGKTRSKPSVWFAQFHGHKFQSFKHIEL